MLKTQIHIKVKAGSAAADNKDFTIPAGVTAVFKTIDYTAPANQPAGCSIFRDPAGANQRVAAAQGDKCSQIPSPGITVDGPETIRLQLDNSQNSNAALLGITVFYEEL